ncbi:hypothetical protein Pmani_030071 [Petrolisthes manimaculis]|uniref:Geminin n=1 Tax=Petrolisthes manimaculis TaxID=1843537 RepID=A0AAE1NYA2_9EUCA|nr:hypothetical protein Pmani_030071 [Petrolisthes manimaculis]
MPEDRKCLGVLQSSMQSQSRLSVTPNGSLQLHPGSRGKKRKSTGNENLERVKAKRKDGIFEDPVAKKQKTYTSVHVQTDSSSSSTKDADSIINMLTSDTPPPEYWEALAEKRREALEDALDENYKLHSENTNLKEEVSKLKEDNKLMEEMVNEAKQLALLLQPIVDEEEEETSEPEATE